MEPEEALHWHILRRKKDGVEDWIDRSVEKIGAVPTLNEVLLPAMKEVGDKFGAGELILPFVLQSAEVMKRAVAQLENYLDRIEGHTKGKVVIATVFGDVHDIGKSLVNTILTNNGYTVVDLGKQVPIDTIIEAAVEHEADAIGLSRAARLDLEADAGLRPGAARARARVPGADRRRRDQPRLRPPHRSTRSGKESDEVYEPGVFYCKDAFAGPRHDGRAGRRRGARGAGRAKIRDEARSCARSRSWSTTRRRPPTTRVRSAARTDVPIPSRRSGARARSSRPRRGLPLPRPPRALQAPLGRARQEGRGVARDRRGHGDEEGFAPRLERMWREQDYLHPRARLGYFPCNADGNELVVFDPEDPERELERLVFPRQPKHDRICLADFYRPLDSGERDVVALQGVTVGPEVTELIERAGARRRVRRAALRPRPRRADRRGPGRVAPRRGPRATSASTPTRAGATPGATRPAPTSPSTRRSGACSTSRRSA